MSDYTLGVALGLAAEGDSVHVWAPACAASESRVNGVEVHRELGSFAPADLRRAARHLDRFPSPRRILVQWVPHGYGYRSMNLPFCAWLWNRAARHGDTIEIMVHEAYLPFRKGKWRQNVAALAHRLMTAMLLRAAKRVCISIPGWERCWRPYAFGKKIPFQWLPVPSNIPMVSDPRESLAIRGRYAVGAGSLIGHFGMYSSPIAALLEPLLESLAGDPAGRTVLLMGIASEQFREEFIRNHPHAARLIQATGPLESEALSCHVSACDLLIQPFPDGVSCRRGSIMAGLCHGKAIVTTSGELTEAFWNETNAIAMAPTGDTRALFDLLRRLETDGEERARMGRAARALYQERFDISHTIAALRETARALEPSPCAS